MDPIEIAVIFGGQLVTAACTVAVLKTDVRWLKQWATTHEINDAARFKELTEEDRRQEDINRNERHDARDEMEAIGRRVTFLEGAARAQR